MSRHMNWALAILEYLVYHLYRNVIERAGCINSINGTAMLGFIVGGAKTYIESVNNPF